MRTLTKPDLRLKVLTRSANSRRQQPSLPSAHLRLISYYPPLRGECLLQQRIPTLPRHFHSFFRVLQRKIETQSDMKNPLTPRDCSNLFFFFYILRFLMQSYKNKFMVILPLHIHCCCLIHMRATKPNMSFLFLLYSEIWRHNSIVPCNNYLKHPNPIYVYQDDSEVHIFQNSESHGSK